MHEVIAFLFGALCIFTGWYILYTRRRLRALKAMFVEVLERCDRLDREQKTQSVFMGNIAGQVREHIHAIEFLTADRTIPPAPRNVTLEARSEEDPRTNVWERLKNDVRDI